MGSKSVDGDIRNQVHRPLIILSMRTLEPFYLSPFMLSLFRLTQTKEKESILSPSLYLSRLCKIHFLDKGVSK